MKSERFLTAPKGHLTWNGSEIPAYLRELTSQKIEHVFLTMIDQETLVLPERDCVANIQSLFDSRTAVHS